MKILFLFLSLLISTLNCKNSIVLSRKEKNKTKMNLIKEAIQRENLSFLNSLTLSEINEYFGEENSINSINFPISGNKEELIKLLEGMEQNLNPFHWSLLIGSKKIIKLLLDKGANPNIITKDNRNWMDLFFIERKKRNEEEKNEDRFEIINYLLDKDASIISHLKEKGMNFLYYLACQENFTKKQYESILSHIKEYIDFNILSFDIGHSFTPLSSAVLNDNFNFIHILLRNNGVKCSVTVEELKKLKKEELLEKMLLVPIINAIFMGKLATFELLFDNKINIEFLEGKVLDKILVTLVTLNDINEESRIKILKRLLKFKKISSEILSEMFLQALVYKKEQVAHYLLTNFKNIDVNISANNEKNLMKVDGSLKAIRKMRISALSYAIRNCDVEIVKELIKRGALVEGKKNEESPLYFIFKGSIRVKGELFENFSYNYKEDKALEILMILVENGINLNKRLSEGLNLVEAAVKSNCQKIAKYLLDKNIELPLSYNLRNSSSYTDTLIYGQEELFIEIFERFRNQELLKKKANYNEVFKVMLAGNKKVNFLNLATQTSNKKVVEYLINKGANPFEKNLEEVVLYFGTPLEEIDKSTSYEGYRKNIKIEKDLNSLDLAIQSTNVKIFDLILLRSKEKELEENKGKIVTFIRNNLIFSNKTFIHHVKEGFFGILKFILINIENEFKDLQPYVNYAQNDETALDIIYLFFSEEKEIIELFKKNSAFKFNKIQEIEKEKKRKESLIYLISNFMLEEAFAKINREPQSVNEADENNITPLIGSIITISKNKENNLSEILYNLFNKILENIKEKQEIDRIDINRKNALSHLFEAENISVQILESLILKGANINFRYGRKYHFIVDIIESSKTWEEKEALITLFKKYKDKILLMKKDLEKLNKIFNFSSEKENILKILNGLVEEADLVYQNSPIKLKNSNEIKIIEMRETIKFKKNFENSSKENKEIIKEQLNKLRNNFKVDAKLLEGLDTKVWEIRKDKIRIFYFINNNNLYLIDLEDNKHQNSLPNAYYKRLALLKKQIVADINFNQKEKYDKFE